MEGTGANSTTSYMEFEPSSTWTREEARDVLVLDLPEFKKDQLKVCINNYGIVKISGEHQEARDVLVVHLPEFKKDQLKVQINDYGILKISGERQVNAETRSKFYKEVSVPTNCISSEIQAKFVNGRLHITLPKKVAPTTPKQDKQPPSSSSDGIAGRSSTEKFDTFSDQQKEPAGSGSKRFAKVAVNLGAIAIVVLAMCAYFFYMCRSVIVEISFRNGG